MLYQYLQSKYMPNEPIFASELQVDGLSDVNVRAQLKKLTDAGLLKRFDKGIYFIPKQSIFKSGSQLSSDMVLEKKYLQENNTRCGYVSGLLFANQLGLTTQVPMVFEVVSNKATTDYRETSLGKSRVIVRKPRTTITEQNYTALQFLDLMKDVDILSELEASERENVLKSYLQKSGLTFAKLDEYLPLYPDKVFRNLYESRLLYGISAQ